MSATSRARSPIPWFGGKQKLCEKIVELMPAHDSYVEVFAGFARHTFSVYSTAAQREVGTERDKRLEVVWASPGCAQPTLFAGVA